MYSITGSHERTLSWAITPRAGPVYRSREETLTTTDTRNYSRQS